MVSKTGILGMKISFQSIPENIFDSFVFENDGDSPTLKMLIEPASCSHPAMGNQVYVLRELLPYTWSNLSTTGTRR
jgi:hypothetical protein